MHYDVANLCEDGDFSERSFSALCREKNLRSTVNLMVLHVHKEHTDKLKLKDVADKFINTGRTFLENNN